MRFDDEPLIPGEKLTLRPGHNSPGRLERVMRAGAFAVTAEIAPPDSAEPEEVYTRAALFDGVVDAMNATDIATYTINTVQKWKERGSIPMDRWLELSALSDKKGKTLTPFDYIIRS